MNAKEQIELVDSTQASNITVDTKCGKCAKSFFAIQLTKKLPPLNEKKTSTTCFGQYLMKISVCLMAQTANFCIPL